MRVNDKYVRNTRSSACCFADPLLFKFGNFPILFYLFVADLFVTFVPLITRNGMTEIKKFQNNVHATQDMYFWAYIWMFICWNSVRGNRKLLLLGYVFISVMVAIGINIYRQVITNARFKRIHVNSAAVPLRLGVEYNEFLAFLGGLICRHTAKLAFFKYTKNGGKNKERKVFFLTRKNVVHFLRQLGTIGKFWLRQIQPWPSNYNPICWKRCLKQRSRPSILIIYFNRID